MYLAHVQRALAVISLKLALQVGVHMDSGY